MAVLAFDLNRKLHFCKQQSFKGRFFTIKRSVDLYWSREVDGIFSSHHTVCNLYRFATFYSGRANWTSVYVTSLRVVLHWFIRTAELRCTRYGFPSVAAGNNDNRLLLTLLGQVVNQWNSMEISKNKANSTYASSSVIFTHRTACVCRKRYRDLLEQKHVCWLKINVICSLSICYVITHFTFELHSANFISVLHNLGFHDFMTVYYWIGWLWLF